MRHVGRIARTLLLAGGTGACGDRPPPLAPDTDVTAPAAAVEASEGGLDGALVSSPGARPRLVIEDALARSIPALGRNVGADALHDAFDRVADALERGDTELERRVADAAKVLSRVAEEAPPSWDPELEALALALTVVAPPSGGRGGKEKS